MPTVREVALEWWEEKQKTILPYLKPYYNSFLELYILPFLGDEEISMLTAKRVDAYFVQVMFEQRYRKRLDRSEVAYGKPILQEIFDFAKEKGLGENLPKAEVSFRINQKTKSGMHGCPYSAETLEEIDGFISIEKETFAGIAMGLAWFAGLTREELLSLKLKDIDFENNLIYINEQRRIWLEEPLREMLSCFIKEKPGPANKYIFTSQKKTRFAGPSIALLIRAAKEKRGIEDETINLNGLRNNYILKKLQTIKTKDLPFLVEGLGVSAISLLSTFGYFLEQAENSAEGVNALYQGSSAYWAARRRKGLNQQTADMVYYAMWKVIADELRKGEPIGIDGFGVFYIKTTHEHYKHNIFTLEFIKVPEECSPVFIPYPKLLFAMNFNADI